MIIYRDAYLKRFCSSELETLAYQEVDDLDPDSTFTTSWRDRLATIKVYMLACLENQADSEDLFSKKYEIYRKEFDGMLAQARNAAVDSEGNYQPIFSISMERS